MSTEPDRVMLDAEQRAYQGVVDRSGPYGDRPSSYAEIAADLKGHSPEMILEALRLLVAAGSLVVQGGSYSLPAAKQAAMRAARVRDSKGSTR